MCEAYLVKELGTDIDDDDDDDDDDVCWNPMENIQLDAPVGPVNS